MSTTPIYIFGEVLFDCFPGIEPVLGGAPFNVAWHLQGFGQTPQLISAVGNDEAGSRIIAAMKNWGMSTKYVFINPRLPTGTVDISLENDEPAYDIRDQCAYDEISLQEGIDLDHPEGAVIYHGTLALRHHKNRSVLNEITCSRHVKRFIDVNLRDPWWSATYVTDCLNYAYFVKLNIHEMKALLACNELPEDWITLALDFKIRHNIVQLLITLGERGAILIDSEGEVHRVTPSGGQVTMTDTVGAGDAYAAVMLLGLVNQWDLAVTMHRAQEFSGYIISQRGAISCNQATYRDFRHFWNI